MNRFGRPQTWSRAALAEQGRRSIESGLEFIESAVSPQGVWQSHYFPVAEPHEHTQEENPFVGALGVMRLGALKNPLVRAILVRTRRFIMDRMEFPGVWRYWPHLPVDMDTSAMCALAASAHPWMLGGQNERLLLLNQDQQGRFLTWIQNNRGESKKDVDAVVNANVIAYLGDIPGTKRAQQWLLWLVREGREKEALHYYWEALDLYAAMAQVRSLHGSAFGASPDFLVSRIQACRRNDGSYGDLLRTALALLSLYSLRALPSRQNLAKSVQNLLDAQREDGGWSACPLSSGPLWPEDREFMFVSRAYEAACCVSLLGILFS